jgi:aspartyl-tRNA synthetase
VRAQGKMAFFDFRDVSGKVQGVVFGKPEVLEVAKTIRPEFIVEISGIVNERNDKSAKAAAEEFEKTGIKDFFVKGVEIEITDIKILNEAETPVFDIKEDTRNINEETRLKYRYLDLRSERMRKNLQARHEVFNFVRNYFNDREFLEIETPLFTKATPEGARDFLVPARLHPGKFYALPQSPQQYKQLLMASGVEKYFQFAKSMRDEDLRGDRQPEFTQMDLEMSFATEEDIMELNEKLLIELVEKLYPEKRIQEIPFPRISYKEAMEKYGNDRPDIREDKDDENLLAFC